jgi:hypothetical protein
MEGRMFIMNALPLVGEGEIWIRRSSLAELREAAQKGATSLIGHVSTAQVLGVPFNRGTLDRFQPGDVYYVARLRVRLPESGDLPVIKEEDLDVYRVEVLWLGP